MIIRTEQMAALHAHAESVFEDRVMEMLRHSHSDAIEGLDARFLRARVKLALERGRAHGFTWQSALAGFCAMMLELGPGFDRHPAFARSLDIRLSDENDRICVIYDNLTDEDWESAQALGALPGWIDLPAGAGH